MKSTDQGFSPAALQRALTCGLGPSGAHTDTGIRLKLAYSGGLDSQVLLHALLALRSALNLSLEAIHVNHGLQAQAETWEAQCRSQCEQWHVPLHVERLMLPAAPKQGIEAAAREQRYAALAKYIAHGDILLTAQHQDDQAETLLLQLLRGSGVPGLAAMPQRAPFGQGQLLRPLLGFTRAELQVYAQDAGLSWIEDASNLDQRYARNALRHTVMPPLRARWPQVSKMLARSAAHLAQASQLLDELAQQDLAADAASHPLPCTVLQALSPARQANALRYWLRAAGHPLPSQRRLQQVLRWLQQPPRSRQARLHWGASELWWYRGYLSLHSVRATPESQRQWRWDLPQELVLPELGYRLSVQPTLGEGLAQAAVVPGKLVVRLRQGGESLLLPARAHHHKLKKLLQQAGVPPWERKRLPLVYIDGELAAVADRWVCQPYVASAQQPGWRLVLHEIDGRH